MGMVTVRADQMQPGDRYAPDGMNELVLAKIETRPDGLLAFRNVGRAHRYEGMLLDEYGFGPGINPGCEFQVWRVTA